MLVLLNVQVSASAIKSCSQMTMPSVSSYEENSHQMMDHSQHISQVEQDLDKVDDCCADNCLCEISSCHYNGFAFHTAESFISNQTSQNRILFVAFTHQNQFLNYLFKPPIFS